MPLTGETIDILNILKKSIEEYQRGVDIVVEVEGTEGAIMSSETLDWVLEKIAELHRDGGVHLNTQSAS